MDRCNVQMLLTLHQHVVYTQHGSDLSIAALRYKLRVHCVLPVPVMLSANRMVSVTESPGRLGAALA